MKFFFFLFFLFSIFSSYSQTTLPTFQATHHKITSSSSCDVLSPPNVLVPLPSQTSIYTGHIRGYWFVAPVNFRITGVRVPTDASNEPQDIAIVRFHNNQPAVYPSTTNAFDQLHITVDDNTDCVITLNIQVQAGDRIGVFCQRGSKNSYSNINFTSSIGGQNVKLWRALRQANLTASGMSNISVFNNNYTISRVELYYKL